MRASWTLSKSLRTKFEIVYLISFYLKGQSFELIQATLGECLSILISSLIEKDPNGHLIEITQECLAYLFRKAYKFYGGQTDNPLSRAFEDMHGIDAVEQL